MKIWIGVAVLITAGIIAYVTGFLIVLNNTAPQEEQTRSYLKVTLAATEEVRPVLKDADTMETEPEETLQEEFFVVHSEFGYLVVYDSADRLYDKTDISLGSLSWQLQVEVLNGKTFYSLQELYEFLETYSS